MRTQGCCEADSFTKMNWTQVIHEEGTKYIKCVTPDLESRLTESSLGKITLRTGNGFRCRQPRGGTSLQISFLGLDVVVFRRTTCDLKSSSQHHDASDILVHFTAATSLHHLWSGLSSSHRPVVEELLMKSPLSADACVQAETNPSCHSRPMRMSNNSHDSVHSAPATTRHCS